MTLARTQFKRQPAKESKPKPGPRKIRCKVCREQFVPNPPWLRHCSPDCGAVLAVQLLAKQKQKAQRVERAADKAKLKTRADWLRETQAVVNSVVRWRDKDDGCISCDKPSTWQGQWHCSHFKSVGSSPSLRFDMANMHKSCSVCNAHLSGNIGAYRPRLIAKIGQAEVDRLEGPQEAVKYTISDLQAIKATYTAKLRELKGK